ncbi:MAG: adenylate/guanylate cyclase domain-containing protein [Desulfobacterales bacterium]
MNGLLFIDDEEGVRRSMTRALKREPYQTYTARNGQEGIDFVEANLSLVEIVISDYKMPGIDGLETLSTIGALNPEVTRIILTGYATMEAAIDATNEGIDGFLTKPFDNVELRAKIHEISVRKYLRQFVPEQIYQKIIAASGALDPTYQEVTILFSDIRDFTHMSQGVPPDTIAAFLNNQYFTPMGEIAYRFNGTVDKHIGDSIMLVFGAPVPSDDDALRAVRAAIEMQKKADEISRDLASSNGLKLGTGISIATGEVFSGILGSRRRKEFTSIGMPVNIASRLQRFAKAGEIVMTEDTYVKVSDEIDATPLPPITVKGIDEPMTIYRVDDM